MASSIFRQLAAGDVAGVRKIVSMYETSVTIKNNQDHTALHVAAQKGNPDMVRELLKARAPHDALDAQGNTPMHLAAETGSVEVVMELLTGLGRRTVLRMKNKEGRTPLHMAAKAHHAGVVAVLMQAGACAAIKDKSGATPLDLVPNLQLDDPCVQALVGPMAAQSPKTPPTSLSAQRSSSSIGGPTDATPPSLSTRASKEGPLVQDASHTRAAAAAAAAVVASTSPIRQRGRIPGGSGLPPAPMPSSSFSSPPPPSASFRASMDADAIARSMTPAGMRRLRAATTPSRQAPGSAAAPTQFGRSMQPPSTPSQFPKSHQIKGGLVSEAATPERPPSEAKQPPNLQRCNSGDEQGAGDTVAAPPQAQSRRSDAGNAAVGNGLRDSMSSSMSRQASRQSSSRRLDQSKDSMGKNKESVDWRKIHGMGEALEAHDTALRELQQGMQRVEAQHAELVELQGKARGEEGADSQAVQQHGQALQACVEREQEQGKALEALQGRVAAVEAQEGVLQELQAGMLELQAGAHDWNSRGDLLERAILIQGEHAEQLAHAKDAMGQQAKRVEELDTRLKFAEERLREHRNRMDQVDDKLKEAGTKDKERRDTQDGLLKQLQSSLARVVAEQQMAQSAKHGPQVPEQQLAQITAQITERVTMQVTDQLMQQLSRQMAAEVEQRVAQQVELLATQQLGDIRDASALVSETETLRNRICKLEDVGAGDQLALLQLRLQQLSSQLADGLGGGMSLPEAGARLATLMAWYRQECDSKQLGDGSSTASKQRGSYNGGPALVLEHKAQLEEFKLQIAELRQQVEGLQNTRRHSMLPPEPPSTPTQSSEAALSQGLALHSAAATPASGAGAAARSRQAHAAAAAESARAEEVSDLRRDLKSLQGQVSGQVACVEGLRGEVKSALATLRREWEVAVETAAVRHAEQMAEGRAREERLKGMRDAAMADDEARRKALDLEARLVQGLKAMENSLGLVQHKIEVLEEQLEEVSTHAAEATMASENATVELAALRSALPAAAGSRQNTLQLGSNEENEGEQFQDERE